MKPHKPHINAIAIPQTEMANKNNGTLRTFSLALGVVVAAGIFTTYKLFENAPLSFKDQAENIFSENKDELLRLSEALTIEEIDYLIDETEMMQSYLAEQKEVNDVTVQGYTRERRAAFIQNCNQLDSTNVMKNFYDALKASKVHNAMDFEQKGLAACESLLTLGRSHAAHSTWENVSPSLRIVEKETGPALEMVLN